MIERKVEVAPAGTPCGWKAYGETGTLLLCQSGREAIHVLTETLPVAVAGTALCAYHSPWDVTDADRAEQEGRTGIEILQELLTLTDVPAVARTLDLVTFHKISVPMSHMIRIIAQYGTVDAWTMRNVVIVGIRQADVDVSMRTVEALIRRGVLEELSHPNNGTPGSLTSYRLTERGRDIAEYLGAKVRSETPECEACHAAPATDVLTLTGMFVGSSAPETQGETLDLCSPCYRQALDSADKDRGCGVVYVLWYQHTFDDSRQYRYNNRSLTTRYVMIGTDQDDMSDRARAKGREIHPGYYATVTGCGFDNPNAQRAYRLTRNGTDAVEY